MRHFGPPHTPDLIPSMEADIQQLCNELLDKAKGKTRFDVVDDYAYPVPVVVICKILGVPLKDEPMFHVWIHDFMAGLMDMGPEISHRRREGPRGEGKSKHGGARAVHGRADPRVPPKSPAKRMLSKMVQRGRPGRTHDAQRRPRPMRYCCSSPVMIPRSTRSPTA